MACKEIAPNKNIEEEDAHNTVKAEVKAIIFRMTSLDNEAPTEAVANAEAMNKDTVFGAIPSKKEEASYSTRVRQLTEQRTA